MVTLLSSLIVLSLNQDRPAYYIDARAIAEVERGEPRASAILFTPDPNILLIVARNLELRWVDLRKKFGEDIVRRGKITDQPLLVLSEEQKKQVADATRWLETIYGTANIPDLKGEVYRVAGDKEFCITDRHDEFFFYSTETGELLRKHQLKVKNIPSFSPDCEFSQDQQTVNLPDYEHKVQNIYDLKTGNLLFSVKVAFLESVRFGPGGKTVLHLGGNKLTTYEIPTGKVLSTVSLTPAKATNLIVSPTGNIVAYDGMTSGFAYDGTYFYDVVSKKSVPVSKELKEFGGKEFSPDGKYFLVGTEKWLNLVEVSNGRHVLSMRPYFSAMWDRSFSVGISNDNSRLILVNDPTNINVDLRYSITYDLNQKPGDPVKYPIKPK